MYLMILLIYFGTTENGSKNIGEFYFNVVCYDFSSVLPDKLSTKIISGPS